MIKVIASDMDGTLLGDNHEIAPQTIEAIHRAQDAGIRFIIATGRNYHTAMQIMEETDIVCDYVLSSGAEVRDAQHRIVSCLKLDMDLCEEIYEILKTYDISMIFCTRDCDYQIGTAEEIRKNSVLYFQLFFLDMKPEEIMKTGLYKRMEASTKIVPDFQALRNENVPVYKIFLYAKDEETIASIEKKLGNNPLIAVASSWVNNLEVTDVRAQKGPVLKEYIESLGYMMDEVMVLGDSMNDYSMLSMDFGATVAMENSVPEIKETVKYITKSNDDLGVAFAIDELLKTRKYK